MKKTKGGQKKRRRVTKRLRLRKKGVVKKRIATKKRPGAISRKVVSQEKRKALEVIGKITHYFPKVKAGVMKITKKTLALGDVVHIKGHTTDFKQKVDSIQLDRAPLKKASKGQEIGLRVKSRVRQNDVVYKVS